MRLPRIIQGGMGVGISNWQLARAVSRLGQLGVGGKSPSEPYKAVPMQTPDGPPEADSRRHRPAGDA